MSLEFEDSINYSENDKTTVIQNISTLELTILKQSEGSEMYEIDQSSGPILQKHYHLNEMMDNYKEKQFISTETSGEMLATDLNEKDFKLISVEIDFLKQSVGYLQSQIHSKSLEIDLKDEKINKLERIIEKQKRKIKDIKSRVKFQETKINRMEEKLPKYYELLEKYKIQENIRTDFDEKFSKFEIMLSKIESKRMKFTSSSPKPKNFASPYRVSSPKIKKNS